MRTSSIVLIILFFTVSLPAQESGSSNADSLQQQHPVKVVQDCWLAKDKVHHLAASAFLTGFGYYAANKEMNFSVQASRNFSVGFSFSFGVLKEVYDGTLGKSLPSYKDIVADLAGIGLGLLLLNAEINY